MRSGAHLSSGFAVDVVVEGSDASPSIIDDRAKFDALARDLERYSRQVTDRAQKGDKLPPAMKMRSGEFLEGGPFANKMGPRPISRPLARSMPSI